MTYAMYSHSYQVNTIKVPGYSLCQHVYYSNSDHVAILVHMTTLLTSFQM